MNFCFKEELQIKTRSRMENFQAGLLDDEAIQALLANFEQLFVGHDNTEEDGEEEVNNVIVQSNRVISADQFKDDDRGVSNDENQGLEVFDRSNVQQLDCDKPKCDNEELKLSSEKKEDQGSDQADLSHTNSTQQQLSQLSTSTHQQAGQVRQVNDDLDRLKTQLRDFKAVIKAKEGLIKDLKKVKDCT